MALSVFKKLRDGLARTRANLASTLQEAMSSGEVDEEAIDDLEASLLAADLGPELTAEVIDAVRARASAGKLDGAGLTGAVRDSLRQALPDRPAAAAFEKPRVVFVVGVNGGGKTTTVGKLASRERAAGRSVIIVAADTFRAAAIDQLERWAERAGAEIVKHRERADPAAVVFDALQSARARGVDTVIVDTAGRLHTKSNLMAELEKLARVAGREVPGAPHEVLLVVDATTGQNGLTQAQEFTQGGRAVRGGADQARRYGQGWSGVGNPPQARRADSLRRGRRGGGRPARLRARFVRRRAGGRRAVTAPREWTAREREWMAQSLALGAQAEGCTSPNPRVGCLVVRDGRVVGRGFHRAPGEPHAEAMAIEEAGEQARGATLYVNLEPCAHHGRTPPCVDLIVRQGIRRVVASIQDPNPLVDGKGFDRLREAGIDVEVGLLELDARSLNEPFFHWHAHGRPLVTVKAALSADGMLSADRGESRWITGPLARRYAHRLRLVHDAILVGAGTVRRDDPRLTVRLEDKIVVRRRVVVSRSLDLDPDAKVFTEDGPSTRIYTSERAATERGARLEGRAEIVPIADGDDGISLEAVLDDLGALGVQSVLVEGGSRTLSGFVRAGLAQRAALFYAGKLFGARGGTPFLDQATVASPDAGWRVRHDQLVPLGSDLLVVGRLCRPDRGD